MARLLIDFLQTSDRQSNKVTVTGVHGRQEVLVDIRPADCASVVTRLERQSIPFDWCQMAVKDRRFHPRIVRIAGIIHDPRIEWRYSVETEHGTGFLEQLASHGLRDRLTSINHSAGKSTPP